MIEMLKERFMHAVRTCFKCLVGRFLLVGFTIFLVIELLTR